MLRALWGSVAGIAVAPLQDLLGLGPEARMNTPGSARGNWQWRLRPGAGLEESAEWLRHITELYGRI
jgi:4-alpha-glucanotransferase